MLSHRIRAAVASDPAVDTDDLLQDSWAAAFQEDKRRGHDKLTRAARVYTGRTDTAQGRPVEPAIEWQDDAAAAHGEIPGYSFRERNRVQEAITVNRGNWEAAYQEITRGSSRVKRRRISRATFYSLAPMVTATTTLPADPAVLELYGYDGQSLPASLDTVAGFPDPESDPRGYFGAEMGDALAAMTVKQRQALYSDYRISGTYKRAIASLRAVLPEPAEHTYVAPWEKETDLGCDRTLVTARQYTPVAAVQESGKLTTYRGTTAYPARSRFVHPATLVRPRYVPVVPHSRVVWSREFVKTSFRWVTVKDPATGKTSREYRRFGPAAHDEVAGEVHALPILRDVALLQLAA